MAVTPSVEYTPKSRIAGIGVIARVAQPIAVVSHAMADGTRMWCTVRATTSAREWPLSSSW